MSGLRLHTFATAPPNVQWETWPLCRVSCRAMGDLAPLSFALSLAPLSCEERKHWHQPQREQIENAIAIDAGIDRFQAVAEPGLDGVAEKKTGSQERQRCADTGGEGDDDGSPQQTKQRATGWGEYRRAGKQQAGDPKAVGAASGWVEAKTADLG